MEQRYATSPDQIPRMDTAELRSRYLVQGLFVDDTATAIYTHHDRVVLLGAKPVTTPVALPTFPEIRSEYFFEHREGGIVNVGGAGTIMVDGTAYELANSPCLYVGRGAQDVSFASSDAGGGQGAARFYVVSAPAHTAYPTTLVEAGKGTVRELGDSLTSNRRTLNQYIHENGVRSCQVVMGVTTLHTGGSGFSRRQQWRSAAADGRAPRCGRYQASPSGSLLRHRLCIFPKVQHVGGRRVTATSLAPES